MGNVCPGGSASSDALVAAAPAASTATVPEPSKFPAPVHIPASKIAKFLRITLCSARDIPAMDRFKSDPFVVVTFGNTATRSHTQYNTLSPTWSEAILVTVTEDDLQHQSHVIRFSVYDQDVSSKNDHIGRCDVALSLFLTEQSESSMELKLSPTARKCETPGEGCAGYLNIKFECSPVAAVRSRAVRDLFSRFDRDGNGRLDSAEFFQLQRCLSVDELRADGFNKADQDHDGFVDIAEFLNCIEQLIPDDVIADYYVKEAGTPLRLHVAGQKGAALTEEQAGRGWLVSMTEWVSRDKYGAGLHVGRKADHIIVYNRSTGLLEEETIDAALAFSMKALYQTSMGAGLMSLTAVQNLLKNMSDSHGRAFSHPDSRAKIPKFISDFQLNLSELAQPLEEFKTFNDFFTRKLKPSARPIAAAGDACIASSPADARSVVFQNISQAQSLWIKGQSFTVSALLGSDELAAMFEGGCIAVFRLAPQDYHRFHFPINGVLARTHHIDGPLYTVNPIAVNKVDVFTVNQRTVSILHSQEFGEVAFVCVGATLVGSIVHTHPLHQPFSKGDEFGYFQFGGSTTILLFQKGRIEYDADLLQHSSRSVEVLLKMGDRVGCSSHANAV